MHVKVNTSNVKVIILNIFDMLGDGINESD